MLLAPNHCWETISWQNAFLYTINCIFEEAGIRHGWYSSEGKTSMEVQADYGGFSSRRVFSNFS